MDCSCRWPARRPTSSSRFSARSPRSRSLPDGGPVRGTRRAAGTADRAKSSSTCGCLNRHPRRVQPDPAPAARRLGGGRAIAAAPAVAGLPAVAAVLDAGALRDHLPGSRAFSVALVRPRRPILGATDPLKLAPPGAPVLRLAVAAAASTGRTSRSFASTLLRRRVRCFGSGCRRPIDGTRSPWPAGWMRDDRGACRRAAPRRRQDRSRARHVRPGPGDRHRPGPGARPHGPVPAPRHHRRRPARRRGCPPARRYLGRRAPPPNERWTVPPDVGAALKAADDD